jgi:FdhD protein
MNDPATTDTASDHRPKISHEGLRATHPVDAIDEYGESRALRIAGEFPLTIKVDGAEIVTLMSLGACPEKLTLGYLRNQRLVDKIGDIADVHVNWEREIVDVSTTHGNGINTLEEKTSQRTTKSNYDQGTICSWSVDSLSEVILPQVKIKQSQIYDLLRNISGYNQIYREVGAVHGCALCEGPKILHFIEDIGRHNATDAIAGEMWLEGVKGDDKWLYTTGRLTSEIVMKVANMGIPVLLSRSGITHMGLELSEYLGITMIARAKGHHFLVYNGKDNLIYDQIPRRRREAGTLNS